MLFVARLVCKVRAIGWRHGMDDGIDVDHACSRLHFANGLRPFDRHPAQGALQLLLPPLGERVHPFEVACRRGEEGDLVDRREEVRRLGRARDEFRRGAAVGDKAVAALVGKRVAAVGQTVMAKIPDRRDLAGGGRVLDGLDARPVESAVAHVHLRPADRFAGDAYAKVHGRR